MCMTELNTGGSDMNEAFFYPDTCEVERDSGEFENGRPLIEAVYSGKCGYQSYNNGYNASGIAIQSSPIVILPISDVRFQKNDSVRITTEKGRVVVGTVEDYEDNSIGDCSGTTLWLKGANDEQ